MSAVLERMENEQSVADLRRIDGATLLARLLLESDVIKIFAGSAENSANRNPNNPFQSYKKQQIVEKLVAQLTAKGKQVCLLWS